MIGMTKVKGVVKTLLNIDRVPSAETASQLRTVTAGVA